MPKELRLKRYADALHAVDKPLLRHISCHCDRRFAKA